MLAVALALAASAAWGVADFGGGLQSRRLPTLTVLMAVQASGLVVVVAVVSATAEPFPGGGAAVLSVAAGLAGALGLAAFYRALAIGTMSVVAPISACGVTIPVVVGVATGDRPSALQTAGLVVAFVGVLLASRQVHEGEEGGGAGGRLSIALALVAAVGFGLYFLASDGAADESVLWLLLLARSAALPLLAVALAATRPAPAPTPRDLVLLSAIGLADLAATGLYALALTKGLLSVVAVVGALYPVATVLLARAVLGERLRVEQGVGVGMAFAGVALVAGG